MKVKVHAVNSTLEYIPDSHVIYYIERGTSQDTSNIFDISTTHSKTCGTTNKKTGQINKYASVNLEDLAPLCISGIPRDKRP